MRCNLGPKDLYSDEEPLFLNLWRFQLIAAKCFVEKNYNSEYKFKIILNNDLTIMEQILQWSQFYMRLIHTTVSKWQLFQFNSNFMTPISLFKIKANLSAILQYKFD